MSTLINDPEEMKRIVQAAVRRALPRTLEDRREDLVSVTLLKVLERKNEGVEGVNRSYLYKVAHSVVVDEYRRAQRRKEESLTPSRPEPRSERVSSDPETTVHGRGLRNEIQSCLQNLAETRRRAVTLYLLGHTVPEASKLLDFSPKKTENLVYRGLSDLRGCLKKKGVEPT